MTSEVGLHFTDKEVRFGEIKGSTEKMLGMTRTLSFTVSPG